MRFQANPETYLALTQGTGASLPSLHGQASVLVAVREKEIMMRMPGLLLALTGIMSSASAPAQQHDEALPAGAMPGSAEVLPSVAVDVPQQAPAEGGPPATRPTTGLDEIVVTAQKREESVQDVPISISAFSGERLDQRGVTNVADLQQVTAGLQFSTFAGYPIIYLRGVGSDAFLPTADPSVATYLDGVYIPKSQGSVQSLGGVERVEVLKGPQGTLFGRNSTGGAISIVTKRPGDAFAASSQVELANFDGRRFQGFVTTPLGDWLGVSANLLYSDMDHQYTAADQSVDPEKSSAGRIRANFHPVDRFDIDLSYFKIHGKGAGTQVANNIDPSALFSPLIAQADDDYSTDEDHVGALKSDQDILGSAITLDLPGTTIKLIGSDQEVKVEDSTYDFDGSPQPIAVFAADLQFTKAKTLELQLLSNDEWGVENTQWIIGAYYYKSREGVTPARFQVGAGAFDFLPSAFLDPLSAFLPVLTGGVQLQLAGAMKTESISGFFQGTWDVTPWFGITLGGRYQEEKREVTQTETSVINPVTDEVLATIPFARDGAKSTNFSPKLVLTVRPFEDVMFYVSGSRGFKSGTYNIVTFYTPPTYVKPEEVTAYELGMKGEWFGRRLRVNAAVFDTRIKNLQSAFVSLFAGGAISFENAGKAEIKGAEFDLTAVPLEELDPGLLVTANVTYLHSEYTEFPNGSGFTEAGTYTTNNDYSGNTIVRSPKWTGNVELSQTFEGPGNGEVEIAVSDYYDAGFYYDAQNTARERAYSLLNARASYLYRPWNVRVTLFGKNILGEKYHVGIAQTDFGKLSTLAYPAQYGLRLNWDF